MRTFILWAMLFTLVAPLSLQAAEDALTNIEKPSIPSTLSPGAVVLLPDGGQSVILSALPNGNFLTDLGISISPQGLILDGDFKGRTVMLDPALLPSKEPGAATLPSIVQPKADTPENKTALPQTPANPSERPSAEKPKAKLELPNTETPKAVTPQKKLTPEEERALTLAQMLPLTRIEEEKKSNAQKPAEKNKPQTPQITEEKKNAVPKTPEKGKVQTPAKEPEAKRPQKAEAMSAKQKPGEALRIPPEAAKTGNLSFLEGCWQGTRPEYYSKRTIKECFCFGANGGSGKRRIFDGPKRTCIGATKAHLSSNGVLSVTSNGAACNDGERWGSAEMVCRNSGPRTPCSWVFTDANNGRQSYEIPFVRVESCGR